MFPKMLIFVAGVVALTIVPLSLLTASPDGQYQSAATDDMIGGTNPLVVVPVSPNIYPIVPADNPLDMRSKADPRFAVPYHDEVQVRDAVLQPQTQTRPSPQVQVRPQYRPQIRVYPQVYSQRPRYVTTTPARQRSNCTTNR